MRWFLSCPIWPGRLHVLDVRLASLATVVRRPVKCSSTWQGRARVERRGTRFRLFAFHNGPGNPACQDAAPKMIEFFRTGHVTSLIKPMTSPPGIEADADPRIGHDSVALSELTGLPHKCNDPLHARGAKCRELIRYDVRCGDGPRNRQPPRDTSRRRPQRVPFNTVVGGVIICPIGRESLIVSARKHTRSRVNHRGSTSLRDPSRKLASEAADVTSIPRGARIVLRSYGDASAFCALTRC